jgi:hypothetical protein
MYGETYFRWGHFFLFMLMGATLGMSQRKWIFNFKCDLLKLLTCIILFYGILLGTAKYMLVSQLQIISLLPLLGITFYLYKLCNTEIMLKFSKAKISGWIIKCISALTLEIYLIQGYLFTDKMNTIFPLNIPIMFLIVIVGAYWVKVLARIFSQTFSENKYDWKAVFII